MANRHYTNMRKGIREMQDELRALGANCGPKFKRILQEEAIEMRTEIEAIVPVLSGRLQARCYVHVGRGRGFNSYTLLAGAKAENPKDGYNYAPIQHETDWYSHEDERQWHFISEPFAFTIEVIAERIRREIKL